MLGDIVRSLRPRQWVKNLFVLSPLLFGGRLIDAEAVAAAVAATVCFCLLSGALYLVNDVVDAPLDRRHPTKRLRPVAAGALPVAAALAGAAVTGAGASALAVALGRDFALVAAMYAGLSLAYSLALKRVVILDVMVIAAGFVLRVLGGAVAVEVAPSHWLIACAFLLALYLGFSKRRQELARSSEDAAAQRQVLAAYSVRMVEQINLVLLAATLVSYLLYTVSPETVARFGTEALLYGAVFVLYGLLRYLFLTQSPANGESPGELLIQDIPLLLCVLGWAVYNAAVIYRDALGSLLSR